MRTLIISLAFLASACSNVPIEAQLATSCYGIAGAYRTAAQLRGEGKLSPGVVSTLEDLAPEAQDLCDSNNPPKDLTGAAQRAATILQQLNIANTGAK